MTGSLTDILPPELQTVSVLLSGVMALLGLVLWSAGVRVARIMLASFLGAVMACVAIWILPSAAGLAVATSGILGLVAGVLIGAIAFRAVQGIAMALVLGAAVGGAYYHWQVNHSPAPAMHAVARAQDLQVDLKRLPVSPQAARELADQPHIKTALLQAINQAKKEWYSIPTILRQGVLILSIGVSIVALAIAWMIPRHTTWIFTAAIGTVLVIFGAQVLIHAYLPQYEAWLPGVLGSAGARWGAVGGFFIVGLLLQRFVFWPGRRKHKEQQLDRMGQVAAA